MLFGLSVALALVLVGVLVWQPKKNGSPSIQSAVDRFVGSPKSTDPLESEIEIIAGALRDREAAKRKAAAMERLRELLEDK